MENNLFFILKNLETLIIIIFVIRKFLYLPDTFCQKCIFKMNNILVISTKVTDTLQLSCGKNIASESTLLNIQVGLKQNNKV
jgi:hypothetical protein